MIRTLLATFQQQFEHLKPDRTLADAIYKYQTAFVNKNSEHLEFFGGNLTGVHVVRFSEKDMRVFFEDILGVDYVILSHALKSVDAINENYRISSDTFNLTCMYLMHVFLTSQQLPEKQRELSALDASLLFNYRCISALLNHYFKYPIDRKLAEATYAVLSQRYLIKQLGSWHEVMLYRAESLVGQKSIHRKVIEQFTDDYAIVNAINDGQGRVRDMLKNIYAEFIKVHRSGERFSSTSSVTIDADGSEIIKDRVHGLEIYTAYLFSVLPDQNSFIKMELVDIIANLIYTVQEKQLIKTLQWISEHSIGEQSAFIETLIRNVMVYSYQYLLSHGYILKNRQDIAGLLSKLRGVYTSSRSTETELIALRETGNQLITFAIGKINEQAMASIRTSVFLYLSLRAYTKNHYANTH